MCNYYSIGGGSYLDLSELKTLHSYGWDLCNHGKTHADLSAMADADSISVEINFTRDYLINNGMRRGADYYTYAGGGGEITQAVMDSISHKHIINVNAWKRDHQSHPSGIGTGYDWYELNAYYPTWANDGNTAAVKAMIDQRIDEGGLQVIVAHDLTSAEVDSLEIVSDYLKTKEDSGDIEVLTWSQYYQAERSGIFANKDFAYSHNGINWEGTVYKNGVRK